MNLSKTLLRFVFTLIVFAALTMTGYGMLIVASSSTIDHMVTAPSSTSNSEVSNISSTTANESARNIEFIDNLGGFFSSVFVRDNYAYVGIGNKLAIFDVSDKSNPVRLAYAMLPGSSETIHVADNYAYLKIDSRLYVYNISDPFAPVQINSYQPSVSNYSLTFAENYAYLVSNESGTGQLLILDLSDPTSLVEVATHNVPYSISNIAVADNTLYFITYQGLQIIDISNPAVLVEVGSLSEVSGKILVGENYLYLAYTLGNSIGSRIYRGELSVIDISDPTNPIKIASVDGFGYSHDMVLVENIVYIAGDSISYMYGPHQLWGIDVSDPIAPTLISNNYLAKGDIRDLAVTDNYAYMATTEFGLRVVDLSQPITPTVVASYDPPKAIDAVIGNYVYAPKERLGLFRADWHILDVSNPLSPFEVASYDLTSIARSIFVTGDYAYAVTHSDLLIINVSTPSAPIEVGTYDSLGSPTSVAVAGNYAYVTDYYHAVRVVDVSDPSSPTEVALYKFPEERGNVRNVAVEGNYAYVSSQQRNDDKSIYNLSILDMSNPANPFEVGSYSSNPINFASRASWLAVEENYAYWATDQQVRVIDISIPSHPVEVSSYEAPTGGFKHMTLAGELYLIDNNSLRVVDVSNPHFLREVAFYKVDNVSKVTLVGDYIYLSSDKYGIFILKLGSFIQGKITDAANTPFSDITISSNSGLTATTDVNGVYTFTNLAPKSYTITPTSSAYSFWPPTRTIKLLPEASNQDFTLLPAPLSIALTADITSSLSYTDTQGLSTQFNFPTDAVSEPTTLQVQPIIASPPTGFVFAGHAFDFSASVQGQLLAAYFFNEPISLTIDYSDKNIPLITNEEELVLLRWNGSAWVEPLCVPESTQIRDLNQNILSVTICQSGRYGLFGPTNQLFLPLTLDPLIYQLMAKHSGKCLDIEEASLADGASAIQWDCSGNDNQSWHLVPKGDYYQIMAQHSRKCLRVEDGSSDGKPVVQSACSNAENQLWHLDPWDGYFQITAKQSQKCLDVEGAFDTNGSKLIQWSCSTRDNQQWQLQLVP